MQENIRFDFDDILITPKISSSVNSRYNDIDPYYYDDIAKGTKGRLPLFTAPMDSVVSSKNMWQFQDVKINVVLPRTEVYKVHYTQFNSFGLKDNVDQFTKFVLIDVANGHMRSVLDWCEKTKTKFPEIKIMAGNIANPYTYKEYAKSGFVDYARIGIGNGNGCLTSEQTGVGYPIASLIERCRGIKINNSYTTKIVADGGMKKYSDIILALALGADYVMLGSILSKSIESSAPNFWKGFKISPDLAMTLFHFGFDIKKEFRGMSTKQAQAALGNLTLKTSEGVIKKYNAEYSLRQWTENFEHYLRSAMSYNDARTLEDFIGKVDYGLITQNAFKRFNK